MSAAYEETVANQMRAADPRLSAFVSANAGSGKTRVLTNRVVRLLLSGVRPQEILCITFTKAAAAEMAGRRRCASDARRRAAAVRPGAGDAGRPQDPDDSFVLRLPAASVSA